MQIIREKATYRAVYLLPDNDPILIDAWGLHSDTVRATDIGVDTHEVVFGGAPELWVGGALSYTAGVWTVLDQVAYDKALAVLTEQKQANLQAEIVRRTQERLDTFAQTRGYDGILSACTYATSLVARFAVEGQYAINSRDATWDILYTLTANVQAGTVPMPTSFADVEPLLPVLAWPA